MDIIDLIRIREAHDRQLTHRIRETDDKSPGDIAQLGADFQINGAEADEVAIGGGEPGHEGCDGDAFVKGLQFRGGGFEWEERVEHVEIDDPVLVDRVREACGEGTPWGRERSGG